MKKLGGSRLRSEVRGRLPATGVSKITRRTAKLPGKAGKYTQWWMYLPREVAEHRTFPFSDGESVVVAVEEDRVVVEKLRRRG